MHSAARAQNSRQNRQQRILFALFPSRRAQSEKSGDDVPVREWRPPLPERTSALQMLSIELQSSTGACLGLNYGVKDMHATSTLVRSFTGELKRDLSSATATPRP